MERESLVRVIQYLKIFFAVSDRKPTRFLKFHRRPFESAIFSPTVDLLVRLNETGMQIL